HGETGGRDREGQDARPERGIARSRNQDRGRHCAIDGARRRRIVVVSGFSRTESVGEPDGSSGPRGLVHMRKHGKKLTAARAQVADRVYSIEEAIPLVKKVKFAKFDETIDLSLSL